MFKKENINKILSILLVFVYSFPASHVLLFHSHDHSHDHNDDNLLYCKTSDQKLDSKTACEHVEHLINTEKECLTCDYFTNCDPVFLFEQKNQPLRFFSQLNKQSFIFLYSDKKSALKNKSPPFII